MGSPAVSLAAPPTQPPDVAAQYKPNVASALTGSTKDSMAANPQGAMLLQGEALEKVLTQMAAQNPKFAPFAQRALGVIKQGIQASIQSPSDAPDSGAQGSPDQTAGGSPPPASFPG